ncbi:MAG: dihydrofolate reductase [Micrococcales bacterium]|nr:dihydrofolate reductase [Micrococcales bacterium]
MGLSLIWAQTPDGVIGVDGTMPWRLPEDLGRFRRLTTGCPVLMGRRTWESLPVSMRPLPGRENIVLSSHRGFVALGATVVRTLEEGLATIGDRQGWVIGGERVFAETLPLADRLEVTFVDLSLHGDTFAPAVDERAWLPVASDPADGWHTSTNESIRYRFVTYARRPEPSVPGAS